MRVFADVEERVDVCPVGAVVVLSVDVQSDGARTRRVRVQVASTTVRAQRHRLAPFSVDDDHVRLARTRLAPAGSHTRPWGATTFSKLGVQFLGLCTEQNR